MSRVVLLDTGPLGEVVHPRVKPEIPEWLKSLRETKTALRIPEIADYELRRELIMIGSKKSIERLNQLSQSCLIPLTPETMRKAAELWASIRKQGKATSDKHSLDGDVILAAQAIIQGNHFDEVVVESLYSKFDSVSSGLLAKSLTKTSRMLLY